MKRYMNHTHAQAHTQLHAHTEEVRGTETEREGHNMHTHIKYNDNPQMTVVIQFSISKKQRLISF